mmetsp:Transcript_4032/g.11556  ORF Transcript_4032/g.11556 Transcript_4032/m.11556 type:complete len:241 (+) Transcript_4032:3581-4303(+)
MRLSLQAFQLARNRLALHICPTCLTPTHVHDIPHPPLRALRAPRLPRLSPFSRRRTPLQVLNLPFPRPRRRWRPLSHALLLPAVVIEAPKEIVKVPTVLAVARPHVHVPPPHEHLVRLLNPHKTLLHCTLLLPGPQPRRRQHPVGMVFQHELPMGSLDFSLRGIGRDPQNLPRRLVPVRHGAYKPTILNRLRLERWLGRKPSHRTSIPVSEGDHCGHMDGMSRRGRRWVPHHGSRRGLHT